MSPTRERNLLLCCAAASHVPWLPYLRDIALPISLWRPVRSLMGSISRIAGGTSDHEDSRRLASGLPACLSRTQVPGVGIRQPEENFHESVTARLHEIHQQDPCNTQGSCPSRPGIGLEQCQSWHGRTWNYTVRSYTWLRAKLLQEEYPSEGYFMNTMWERPKIALVEIPTRLMMLLSGTDNRRYRSGRYSVSPRITPYEVEELQLRAREYTRQQVEQMNVWERAFHREWVSLISRNAISFPYPMEGTLEDGTTTSESIQTTPAFQDWNFNATPRGMAMPNIRSRGRIRPGMTGAVAPETTRTCIMESHILSIPNGRNFGGWDDNIRIDPNYYSLQDLEFQHAPKPWGKGPKGNRVATTWTNPPGCIRRVHS